MKKNAERFVLISAACIFLFSSCATTKLTMSWKDTAFKKTIQKIIVIGVSGKAANRNFFEDEFVRRLKEHGVDAVASYDTIPFEALPNKNMVAAKIRRSGADTVIVTRLVDRKTVQTYIPGQAYVVPNNYYRWGSYYQYVQTPGRMVENRYAYAETNLYDVDGEKLIWSAGTETEESGTVQDIMQSFVNVMINKLAADKLIR